MACAAGDFETVKLEGLQAVEESLCSNSSDTGGSSGCEADLPAGKYACSNSAAGQDSGKAAPGPAVSAGLAAQSPQARAEGLCKPSSGDRMRSREQPSKAGSPLLTWADAHRMLDIRRVTTAAIALIDMLKEARLAQAKSQLMLEYLLTAKTCIPSCFSDAQRAAELLYSRAMTWTAAQKDRLLTLAWAIGKTCESMDGIRQSWEGRLQMFFDGEAEVVQALSEDIRMAVNGYSDASAACRTA